MRYARLFLFLGGFSGRRSAFSTVRFLALSVAALGLCACGKPQITTYRVEKPAPPPADTAPPSESPAPAASSALPVPNLASGPGPMQTPPGGLSDAPPAQHLDWTAPAGWQEQPARPMRRATYLINGAELAITSFPGDVGGLAANINRWRTQLALPQLPPQEAIASAEKLAVDGQEGYLLSFAGSGSGQMSPMGGGAPTAPASGTLNRTLGLILPYAEETWFFKLGGPDAVVAGLETQFRQFITTIRSHAGPTHDAHVHAPMATPSPAPASGGNAQRDPAPQLSIHVPPGWTASPERRAFRVVTINVPAPGGDPGSAAELAVTALSGPYGTLEENAERWWGELRSPAIETPTTLKIQTVNPAPGSPFKIRVVDLSAPSAADSNPPAEGMLAGIVEYGQFTWFCKLKGPANTVESQRATFTEFLSRLTLDPVSPTAVP